MNIATNAINSNGIFAVVVTTIIVLTNGMKEVPNPENNNKILKVLSYANDVIVYARFIIIRNTDMNRYSLNFGSISDIVSLFARLPFYKEYQPCKYN